MRVTRQADTLLKRSTDDDYITWETSGDAFSGGPDMEEWQGLYDLDHDERPQGVELHEHGRLVEHPSEGGLGFRYDGDSRYPGYHKEIWRSVPEGGEYQESHTIERNPQASREYQYGTGGRDSVLYPWAYTFTPPGGSDSDSVHKGFNTLQEALATHSILSVYGHEHPRGQKALEGFERWE